MRRIGRDGYSWASAPKAKARAAIEASATLFTAAFLQLRQHRLGAAHFVLPRRLDVELLHHAVLDEHRVALRAHAHVARGEVELQAQRPGPVDAAVAHHADLAVRLLVAAP